MMLSVNWLRTLVDLDELTPEDLAEKITFHIAEVEGIERVGEDLDGVIAARVLSVQPHPDADRLRCCTVETGGDDPGVVVCGAPNVAEGQMVCYAPLGTTLPGGGDGPITLEKRAIRGIESHGMICAEDELGLGDSHDGILVLDETVAPGTPVADALGLRDAIIEVGNTAITHRPDLWGHLGFARELGALLGKDLLEPSIEAAEASLAAATGEPYAVAVEDETDCPRYMGLVLEGLTNGPSPIHVRQRLESLGVRSIDRLVDLTNWVLLEQGQPLHAFDLRAIGGSRIIVRRAQEGERMQGLDEIERTLASEDLVIADAERPVAIAGVMGSLASGMVADTTGVLLEAATFDPVRVRRTSTRLGLRTEASSRFEKSLDPHLPARAALRFAQLALEACPGARIARPAADVWPAPPAPVTIELPLKLIRRRLGLRLPDTRVRRRLTALGFSVQDHRNSLQVGVPTWRATKDIEGCEDLVEEIGRLEGYGKIPVVAPVASVRPTLVPPGRRLARRLGAVLSLDLGYHEVANYAFYGAQDAAALGIADTHHVALSNPLSEGHDRLVLTTAANLLKTAARNVHQEPAGRLWEQTRLIPPGTSGALPDELRVVGLVSWNSADGDDPAGITFRGLLEDLRVALRRLGLARVDTTDGDAPALAPSLPAPIWLHPGRQGALRTADGRLLAVAGEVAPAIARHYGLKEQGGPGRVAVAEIHMDALLEAVEGAGSCYQPVLRYPVVPFDVSLLAPRRVPAESIARTIEGAAVGHVRNVQAFDVYEGEGVPGDQRSLAFSLELYDAERTLSSKSADRLRAQVIDALRNEGWTVRTA
jgi:phenylalanyl-tRNA synthetase beta chain